AFVKDGELIIYTGKVTAYLKVDCTKKKEFDDKTLVTDDYTLDDPKTRFDEWIDDSWVTNLQNQYQAQVQQVTDKRAYLYLDVDRLANEGKRILDIEGDEEKAEEYRLQANALYLKIRSENPWPTPPEA
ncbi:phage tail protein, partial [Vibrio sp. A14(2019)]